jgi:glycine oxidase
MPSTQTFDVAVVGAGIIGLSAAFELSTAGLRVVVLDRQEPGLESSWAAAGMLAPGPDSPRATALVPLAKESFALYPGFVSAIEDASSKSVSFEREGTLEVFPGPSGEVAQSEFLEAHRRFGLGAEIIDLAAARRMEPSLNSHASAVAWLPDEATVDPRLLVQAVAAAATNRGAQIRANYSVTSLILDGDRCLGVLANNERISARHVLIAAGAFCGNIEKGIARCAPTRPVRGQMLALKHPDVRLTRVLRSEKGYLVPRSDGRIIAGSTLEDAGFEKNVTQEGQQKILSAAIELAPALAGVEILEKWSGLRPGTPDDLPILGPTDIEGLLVATGHYRNGILLAPVTAELVREWITAGKTQSDVGAFSPLRFQNPKSNSALAEITPKSPG